MALVRCGIAACVALTAVALCPIGSCAREPARHVVAPPARDYAVGPQYDTTHVYVPADDFDRFVAALLATFGGTASQKGEFTVTPTSSRTLSQLVLTPVGTLSVFGFRTPVPAPFGSERTGYLLSDFDAGIAAARAAGADVLVEPFPDPIGRDAVVQWAGGVNMQFYWHTVPPDYPVLVTVPENRVYLSAGKADAFVRQWMRFSKGRVLSDNPRAPGAEIGAPGKTFRSIALESRFGRVLVLVTDGHLAWPFGRELTGYAVSDLAATLEKGRAAGVEVLVGPYAAGDRDAAMVRFPGGYIAEIHAPHTG